MKTNYIYKVMLLTFSILAFASCDTEELYVESSKSSAFEVSANLDIPASRAQLVQKDFSLDYASRWQGHESVYAYCSVDGKLSSDRVETKITDVAPSGSTGKFLIEPKDSWKKNGKLSDDNEYFFLISTCHPVLNKEENKLCVNAKLRREPLDQFMISAYAIASYMEDGMVEANFNHYNTYEILHVYNKTDKPIKFTIDNFEATTKWYREQGFLYLNGWGNNEFKYSPDAEAPVLGDMTVDPARTNVMVSAYVPNGQKINDARLIATIDGKQVKTSNTISSDVDLQVGHAYHMYVTWDGEKLEFGKYDPPVDVGDVTIAGYDFVDLGLPSGTQWATRNIGAETPDAWGDYFAWGETKGLLTGKTGFSWKNYTHCRNGETNKLTKYTTKDQYSNSGRADNKTILEYGDDAASVNIDAGTRIPTVSEWQELMDNCFWYPRTNGMLVQSKKNGKAIFLPKAGYRQGLSGYDEGLCGYYWTANLDRNFNDDAWFVYFGTSSSENMSYYRSIGRSIRPVHQAVYQAPSAQKTQNTKECDCSTERTLDGGLSVKIMSRSAVEK